MNINELWSLAAEARDHGRGSVEIPIAEFEQLLEQLEAGGGIPGRVMGQMLHNTKSMDVTSFGVPVEGKDSI